VVRRSCFLPAARLNGRDNPGRSADSLRALHSAV
jgi:hypothetical protein